MEIDLNSNPGLHDIEDPSIHNAASSDHVENRVNGIEDEVEATIILGDKLGANLNNSHGLIRESIVLEGLQGVTK